MRDSRRVFSSTFRPFGVLRNLISRVFADFGRDVLAMILLTMFLLPEMSKLFLSKAFVVVSLQCKQLLEIYMHLCYDYITHIIYIYIFIIGNKRGLQYV